jgi:hypothetical protein
MKSEEIGSLGKLDGEMVFGALGSIILGQLGAQPAGLNADHGIDLGIEIGLAAEKLRGDLILLHRSAGVVERLLG